ncbi:MAG: epoxyqueuosine reductase QueH [Mucispirillum sp.]|nr:epoxyqueuosine reductase QueH [Mucispirillum sp.]
MNILLHQCCGPCSAYPIKKLLEKGWNITTYFFNHNIHPVQEFYRRLEGAILTSRYYGITCIADEYYGLKEFTRTNAYKEDERCFLCYERRLMKTAEKAKELNFDAFSSSLLYSRMQNHEAIRNAAEKAAQKYDIAFFYEDFRNGWQEGIDISKELDIYRQNYCGCIYSEEDRFLKQLSKKYGVKYGEINLSVSV